MSRDWTTVKDILEAAHHVQEHVSGIERETFVNDVMRHSAVLWHITIIGEATKRLSNEFRTQHEYIPWKQIAGMRNVLIHGYDEIDLDLVWSTATTAIPKLIEQLESLIPPESSE